MEIKTVIALLACAVGSVGVIAAVQDQLEQRKSVWAHQMRGPYERYWKRPLDAMMAAAALLVLSPVLLVAALLVRVHLGNPVIFQQERPGRNEKIFRLYKFRSMTDERDEDGNLLPEETRLTEFGKKLRSTSIDELPELWNILRGDMSFIGPRPLLTSYLPYYTVEERPRHEVRPGLSGLAQVNGRNLLDWDKRLALDAQYVRELSFLTDTRIFLKTVQQVFRHKGVSNDIAAEGNLAEIRSRVPQGKE